MTEQPPALPAEARSRQGRRLNDNRRWQWEAYIYAGVSLAEHEMLKKVARREGMTMSDFIRRCVNSLLIEEGDEVPLLTEQDRGPAGRNRP